MTIKIRVLGAGKEVGRAAIVVEEEGEGYILDYGVNFDDNDLPRLPEHYPPSKVKALIISHVHLDHIGAAPIFYISSSPKAYATKVTIDLADIMLSDFLKLSGYYLPFEDEEVKSFLSMVSPLSYREPIEMGKATLEFIDAGHIPGSAMIRLETKEHCILYTGDVNFVETNLTNPADIQNVKADTLIMESTYGSSKHPPRSLVEERFYNAVREVYESNGVVLVPAFSVGRGQEILSLLWKKGFEGPIHVDGMIRTVTEIMLRNPRFLKNPSLLKEAYSNAIVVRGWQDRRRAWREPGVIIASAGMLKGGPAKYYLKKIYEKSSNAVFLVSFQAENTPGRMLLEKGRYEEGGKLIKARLEWFDFSSHASKPELVEIARSIRGLKRVILVHGEPDSLNSLATTLYEELGVEVYIPSNGDVIELD